MILEDATHEAYGYYPSELKPHSNKPILAPCELCGRFRVTKKNSYHFLCRPCMQKGRIYTEETKAKIGAAAKGRKHTEESKALMSAAKRGEKHWKYNGGKKVAKARKRAKRDRELGYTLLMPLAEGEEGHHVTDEYVIGIPADVHNSIGGSRKKHRTLVLQWLKANDKKKYLKVLCVLAKQ